MSLPSFGARHRRGLIITAIGGLALSFDMPLLRAGQGEVWSVLALRSACTFAAGLLAWILLNRVFGRRVALVPGKAGFAAGLFYAVNAFTFQLAVFNTSIANVAFILAFTSMFAALLSWIFLKERPSNATLATLLVMIAGVGIIVQGSLEGGHLFGDAMALCSSFLLACTITIARASGEDMGLVPLVTAIVPASVAFAYLPHGMAIAEPFWIVFDGLIVIPLAFFCLASGPRYLSGPEVGMFYLLETILAPIWIWAAFSETPSPQTITGGGILIAALTAHSFWQMRKRAPEAAVPPVH